MAKPPKISVTTNYKLFLLGPDNRPLDILRHRQLRSSMEQYGFIPDYHIICERDDKGRLIIKDGQHRFHFAQELGLPVYWTETAGDFDVAHVNSAQKSWQPADYVARYVDAGNADYQELLEFKNDHQIPITIAAMLLAGATTFTNIATKFYAGDFQVVDRPWAKIVIGVYSPMVRIEKGLKTRNFLLACMAIARVKGFSVKRLADCATRCRNKIALYSTRDAYLDMLEEIYNFGRKDIAPLKIDAVKAMRSRNPASRTTGDGNARNMD